MPRRRRPGTVALREIQKYQKTTELLIPKQPFQRITRNISADLVNDRVNNWRGLKHKRLAASGLVALQEGVEAHLIGIFEDAIYATVHCKRATLMSKDLALVKRIRNFEGKSNFS